MPSPQSPISDPLPARMINEFVYCPRLFYYEHVEGVFVHNLETIEGAHQHKRVDARTDEFPPAESLAEEGEKVTARSVTLASETHGVLAKMDLLESDGRTVTPVDYKRGSPQRLADGGITAWPTDLVQLGVQALILRDNGYECREAIVYYATTRQRVRLSIDEHVIRDTLTAIAGARKLSESRSIPPPLEDSPKCPRCSLVGVCLPDETRLLYRRCTPEPQLVQRTLFEMDTPPDASVSEAATEPEDIRRLVPARDDLRPLYLNSQGLYVGVSGGVLKVKEKDKLVQEVRINDICQVNLLGNIQITTQAIQALCQADVPVGYFSMGGWFYGLTRGLNLPNVALRREQFRWADIPGFCLRLARALVSGKVKNQRTLLMRNHVEPPRQALAMLKCMQDDALRAESMETLLGIEGNAARTYFANFSGMLKQRSDGEGSQPDGESPATGLPDDSPPILNDHEDARDTDPVLAGTFDFRVRNRRPPRDPVNALLSLAYSLLTKDLTLTAHAVGFDPYLGFYHQLRHGRPSLALDLMEPFRPLIADSVVLSAINNRMVTGDDFLRAGGAVVLTPAGRKKFFLAYEQRMDTLVTHPRFGYRVSYRRVLEVQTRLLARVLTGEISEYPVFTTR